jgi:hypothetical protein
MRVKVAKAAGGEFYHFRRRHLRQFVRGADDGVGDQMRQMAGDREHEIMMIRRHDLDLGAEAGPERAQFFDASASVPSGGVRMHQRLMNSSGKAGIGPECSVPATGCAGTKWTPDGICGPHVARDGALDRTDVGHDRALFENGAISWATGPQAPTGMQRMTRSAPFDRFRVGLQHRIDNTQFLHPRAGFRRACRGDDLAGKALQLRGTRNRATDQTKTDQRNAF